MNNQPTDTQHELDLARTRIIELESLTQEMCAAYDAWIASDAAKAASWMPAIQRLDVTRKAIDASFNPLVIAPITYCYSLDEEHFQGEFETENAAIQEAIAEAEGEGQEMIFVGQSESPRHAFSEFHCGEQIWEYLSEQLSDIVGEVGENFLMSDAQEEALGRLVLDWVERIVGFNCFTVTHVRGVAVPESVDEEAQS